MRLRRRAWQEREVVLEPGGWEWFADRAGPVHEALERAEVLEALRVAIEGSLTRTSAEVFVALALNEVPIDVLAEPRSTRPAVPSTRRSTTPGGGCAQRWPSRG